MDVFCTCRWNFDDSDSEKDKGLFMACCSFCEEWFYQKCVKIKKGSVFGRESPQMMEMTFMSFRLSDTYLFYNYK